MVECWLIRILLRTQVRPLVCKTYPLYISKAISSGIIIDQPDISICTSLDEEIKNRYPNIQNIMNVRFDPNYSKYKKEFPLQSDYFKKVVYIERKTKIFLEVWLDYFINPIDVKPNIIENYFRYDMSHFWTWLSKNKDKFYKKRLLETIGNYKQKINELNKLFNLNIDDFL